MYVTIVEKNDKKILLTPLYRVRADTIMLEIRYVQVRSVQKLSLVQPIREKYKQMKTIP